MRNSRLTHYKAGSPQIPAQPASWRRTQLTGSLEARNSHRPAVLVDSQNLAVRAIVPVASDMLKDQSSCVWGQSYCVVLLGFQLSLEDG